MGRTRRIRRPAREVHSNTASPSAPSRGGLGGLAGGRTRAQTKAQASSGATGRATEAAWRQLGVIQAEGACPPGAVRRWKALMSRPGGGGAAGVGGAGGRGGDGGGSSSNRGSPGGNAGCCGGGRGGDTGGGAAAPRAEMMIGGSLLNHQAKKPIVPPTAQHAQRWPDPRQRASYQPNGECSPHRVGVVRGRQSACCRSWRWVGESDAASLPVLLLLLLLVAQSLGEFSGELPRSQNGSCRLPARASASMPNLPRTRSRLD